MRYGLYHFDDIHFPWQTIMNPPSMCSVYYAHSDDAFNFFDSLYTSLSSRSLLYDDAVCHSYYNPFASERISRFGLSSYYRHEKSHDELVQTSNERNNTVKYERDFNNLIWRIKFEIFITFFFFGWWKSLLYKCTVHSKLFRCLLYSKFKKTYVRNILLIYCLCTRCASTYSTCVHLKESKIKWARILF